MNYSFEKTPKRPYFPEFQLPSHLISISVDEAGRGCLAGPVSVGFVSFTVENLRKIESEELLVGIRDSKKLTLDKRKQFVREIKEIAAFWKVVFVSHRYIDAFNINRAIFYGINRGIPHHLEHKDVFVFADGNYKLQLGKKIEGYLSLPKGDDLVPSISAASVLAKTYRDTYMEKMDLKYPGYGFGQHKGYGTEYHREQIKKIGISPIHRLSFLKFLRKEDQENLFSNGEPF